MNRAAESRTAVVIPTYHRPADLKRCTRAVLQQDRMPDELVIVHRNTDDDSRGAIAELAESLEFPMPLRVVTTSLSGVVAAMTAGVEATSTDIIAFIDDDAVPSRTWLRQLTETLEGDPMVGAVGGRDNIPGLSSGRARSKVGVITSYGRVIGNHHLGTGAPRHVDIVKGVNMAFRRTALALPTNLRGSGAEVHYEIASSQWAASQGFRVIYDPTISVDHFLSQRTVGSRTEPSFEDLRNAAFNLVFTAVGTGSCSLWRRGTYGILVGDRGAPGLLRAIFSLVRRERGTYGRLLPSLLGQLDALAALRKGERPKMTTFAHHSTRNVGI